MQTVSFVVAGSWTIMQEFTFIVDTPSRPTMGHNCPVLGDAVVPT